MAPVVALQLKLVTSRAFGTLTLAKLLKHIFELTAAKIFRFFLQQKIKVVQIGVRQKFQLNVTGQKRQKNWQFCSNLIPFFLLVLLENTQAFTL